MKIVAHRVSKGHAGIPLPETTLAYESGTVTVAEAEVGDHPTVLALLMSGRMIPDSGTLTIDGADDAALVRERIALVDAPDVSEPAGDILLKQVVKEELMFAGRSTSRATVAQVIAENGGADFASVRIADVPAAIRVRLLTEIASFRAGVEGLVITSPDRHGGDPREWLAVADDLAARGFAVLVVCGYASAEIVRPMLPPAPSAEAAPADDLHAGAIGGSSSSGAPTTSAHATAASASASAATVPSGAPASATASTAASAATAPNAAHPTTGASTTSRGDTGAPLLPTTPAPSAPESERLA